MDKRVDPAAPGADRTAVVQINHVDLDVVRRFFDTTFYDIPKELMDGWFEVLRKRPVAAFTESLTKANRYSGTIGAREFTLIMAGVALAHGSSDPVMTRGFDIGDKVRDVTKGVAT